jgi:hypothetical protein
MPANASIQVVTPQAAVDRAGWVVNGPVLLVMGGPAVVSFAVGGLLHLSHETQIAFAGIVFAVCWPLAWLTWSFLTPRWRLWAYERVDDIDELKRLAVIERVLWPDGHIFQRTEIAPGWLREKLHRLEQDKRRMMENRPGMSNP